jgi:hypothetical protein
MREVKQTVSRGEELVTGFISGKRGQGVSCELYQTENPD